MKKTSVSQLTKSIHQIVDLPHFNKDFLNHGQLASKEWLVNELISLYSDLDLHLGTIFICAGWYGSLATMLFESEMKIDKIRSFDIDPSCAPIADTINRPWVIDGWKFKASTLDIHDIKYPTTYTTTKINGTKLTLTEMPDTIINTSCEHIENFRTWYDSIPPKTLVILQTNNYFEIPEHINCSNNLSEFSKNTPMSELLYEGTLELPKYQRYMRIGTK